MASLTTLCQEGTGFNFDYVQRNALLTRRGVKEPTQRSTGTTLCGLIYKNGVVMASDTRATAGEIVADKNTEKLEKLAPNIYSSALTLHSLATGRQARVITAETIIKNHLRRYGGHVSAALIVGGIDFKGPHLTTIAPHGSTDSVPYATMGSGSLNAMSVLESGYKEDMEKEEAMVLATRAIRAGVYNDLASGSNVDMVIITKDGAELIRPHQLLMGKNYKRAKAAQFPAGSVKVLAEKIISLKELVIDDADAMDTS